MTKVFMPCLQEFLFVLFNKALNTAYLLRTKSSA